MEDYYEIIKLDKSTEIMYDQKVNMHKSESFLAKTFSDNKPASKRNSKRENQISGDLTP